LTKVLVSIEAGNSPKDWSNLRQLQMGGSKVSSVQGGGGWGMFVLLLTPAPAAVLVMRKGGRQEVGRIGTEKLEKRNVE
jgi:hypothetical protein